ncbi:uncharacterized protein BKA78DRAFT_326553 [Phyllosticta capitalensis]|uniref:uncharacterized protein n=1 Tax=Phyllosticta capitalensis TaxID=121624 RepID=UPI003131F36F
MYSCCISPSHILLFSFFPLSLPSTWSLLIFPLTLALLQMHAAAGGGSSRNEKTGSKVIHARPSGFFGHVCQSIVLLRKRLAWWHMDRLVGWLATGPHRAQDWLNEVLA